MAFTECGAEATRVSAPDAGFRPFTLWFQQVPRVETQVTPPVTVDNPFCAQPPSFEEVPAAGTFSNLAAPVPG